MVKINDSNFSGCWNIENKLYRFIESDVQFLPSGFYIPRYKYPDWFLEKTDVYFDKRASLKSDLTSKVIESVEKFWNSAELYKKLGAIHKRGIFFYGPPGTGKSAAVNVLCCKVVEKDGVVILAGQKSIDHIEDLIRQVRCSDKNVPIAVVMEDIETFIREEKEQKAVLSLLSGQRQIGNVLFIGTSNLSLKEISEICGSLVNRPSRFDVVEYVGFPGENWKTHFLRKFCSDLSEEDILHIAKSTPDCSVAHLKEIVIAYICLEEDLNQAINRIKKMKMDVPEGINQEEYEDDPEDYENEEGD